MPPGPTAILSTATEDAGRVVPAGKLHALRAYAEATAGSLVAVAIAMLVQHWFGLGDVSPVFMLAVLGVASRTRTGPAVLTAILCFLGYNFFFFEPRYTFYISAPQNVATILLFLTAALLAGRLASRLAMQVSALRSTNAQVRLRQELGQRLAAAVDEQQIVGEAQRFFDYAFGAIAEVEASKPVPAAHDGAQALRFELGTPQAHLGALLLTWLPQCRMPDANECRLIESMAGDVAQALLRARLVADLQTERVANETERLRSALLSSVSHDLRTPLAAMLGAAETLESYGATMDADDRRELLATVREEGRRLDRYIQNLLDMTRLGRGELALNRDWIGVDELVGSAIGRLQRYQPGVRFDVAIAADVGPIWVHPALVEQALFNVIENAAKFSPPDAPIAISAQRVRRDRPEPGGDGRPEAAAVRIDVRDRGPGIPAAERERIFEMFYSMNRGDRGLHGTGLGLAICRGMVAAHGGSVEALVPDDGCGTIIRITLPLLEPAKQSGA